MRKSFDAARALLDEAARTYERLGLRLAHVGLRQVSGLVELLARDPVEAERVLREGFDYIAVDFPAWRAYQSTLLAEALYEQERFDEARELIESAEPEHADELENVLPWAVVKARLLAREGAAAEGEALLRDIADRAAQTDALNVHGRALLALADVLSLADRHDEAREAAAGAAEIFERKGNVAAAERAAALMAVPSRTA